MAAALRDTSDYFDEVDIMAASAMPSTKKRTIVDQPDSPPFRLLGSTAIDSTSALDEFLNDILNLGDAATVAAAVAAGLPGAADRFDEDQQRVDESSMSVLERRRLRRPKDAPRMTELVHKQLADWSRYAGVMGVICVNIDGRVLMTDMPDNVAREMAGRFHQLMPMVRKSIKQIDPDDELELIRFRTQNYEVLAITEKDYTMLVVSICQVFHVHETQNPRAWRTLLKGSNNPGNADNTRKTSATNERLLHKGIFKILDSWKRQREMKQQQQ